MALGARRAGVVWLMLRSRLTLVAIGVAVGAIAAFLASSVLTGVLFEVEAAEPWVYWIATALLIATGLLAALGPTLRATRIDPAETLRCS